MLVLFIGLGIIGTVYILSVLAYKYFEYSFGKKCLKYIHGECNSNTDIDLELKAVEIIGGVRFYCRYGALLFTIITFLLRIINYI
jgi:hypothetical protein